MTLATMTDRSLPLAERVNAAYLVGIQVADGDENGQDARAALDGLRADVAAADRLAALVAANYEGVALGPARRADSGNQPTLVYDGSTWYQTGRQYAAALAAYRERMQGVARGV